MIVSMILSSFMLTNRRKTMEAIPESWKKIWDLWEVRFAVLLSLTLQICLIFLGQRRKVSDNIILRFILWLAYNSADSVATFCLSILSSGPADIIKAIWAPILLLHLGGPDTITAYSLEDNELWQRRVLQFGAQTAVAGYVLLNVWTNHGLNIMGIAMLFTGILKCLEKIWALWHASRDHFKDSLLSPADPGPNYARDMEEYKSKRDEGFEVRLGELINEAPRTGTETNFNYDAEANDSDLSNMEILRNADKFFGIFQRLFADLILSFDDILKSRSFLSKRSYHEAFKVIEIELGFTYDLFYTKPVLDLVFHSLPAGVILHCITFFSTLSILCGFLLTVEDTDSNVIITYVLLAGAVFLEILAIFLLLCSDRAVLKLGYKHSNLLAGLLSERNRWSNSMAQCNLIKFFFEDRSTKGNFIQNLSIYKKVAMHRFKETVPVPGQLKHLIYKELQERLSVVSDLKKCKQFCTYKGEWVFERYNCLDQLQWSIIEAEFDQSILLWHIATYFCYYEDFNDEPHCTGNDFDSWKMSILLSNYMLYIQIMCPFMLPNGIGQIRLRDTCAEATEFFEEFGPVFDENKARTMLYNVCTDLDPSKLKGDRCKSVLFQGCQLAKDLKSLQTELKWDRERKWELISRLWIEMLFYAANQCRWTDHAQQLRRGGELLTHVWLLMAHFGITQQFQVSQGHARAKLIFQ